MTYQEAKLKSLTVKWKVVTCVQGEQCWCRGVECDPPILFMDGDTEESFYPIQGGKVLKDIVEHIVRLHNKSLT